MIETQLYLTAKLFMILSHQQPYLDGLLAIQAKSILDPTPLGSQLPPICNVIVLFAHSVRDKATRLKAACIPSILISA